MQQLLSVYWFDHEIDEYQIYEINFDTPSDRDWWRHSCEKERFPPTSFLFVATGVNFSVGLMSKEKIFYQ